MLWIIVVALLAGGAVLHVLALRFRAGLVPMSWHSGQWPRRLQRDDATWRTANARTWWVLLLGAIFLEAGGIAVGVLVLNAADDGVIAIVALASALAGVAAALGQGLLANRLA